MPPSDVRLRFFGYPRATFRGSAIELRIEKAWALLAFLVLTDIPHSREAVSGLLWPNHSANRALANLRNVLWTINQTPLGICVDATRSSLRAGQRMDFWVDVGSFRDVIGRLLDPRRDAADPPTGKELAGAFGLYEGDLLAGLHVDAAPSFEDWLQVEAAALRHEAYAGYQALLREPWPKSTPFSRLEAAESWLSLQPYSETALTHVANQLIELGRRDEALRRIEGFERTVRSELNLTLSPAVSALRERARRATGDGMPPLMDRAGRLRNAPSFRSPFVGREREIELIVESLRAPDCRLLTIAGPGGSGKTRLAVEAASLCADAFSGGAFFVPLSQVDSPRGFALALGHSLGIPFTRSVQSEDPRNLVPDEALAVLREREILLVLDNMEHLPGVFGWIERILSMPCRARILATSREQLALRGERVLRVVGLPFPQADVNSIDAIRSSDAVRLFVSHARQLNPGFAPTLDDWQRIASICHVLDGLPLAIEIAASWIRTIGCKEIDDSVRNDSASLSTPLRHVPKRHRSLRTVFTQSWERLSRDERAVARRLAVFHGPFTTAGAREIAGASVPLLSALVRHSLVQRTPAGRYQLLRIVREQLEERLRAMPDAHSDVRTKHSTHYLRLLEEAEPALQDVRQKRALEDLTEEFDNIQAAWRFAAENGLVPLLARAMTALFLFIQMRSRYADGVTLFGAMAQSLSENGGKEDQDSLLLAQVLEGWFSIYGREATAEEILDASTPQLMTHPLGKKTALAVALTAIAQHAALGRLDVTADEVRKVIEYHQSADDAWGECLALETLSTVQGSTDPAEAIRPLEKSIAVRRRLGDQWGLASALLSLGGVLVRLERFTEAEKHLKESMAIHRYLEADPFNEMGVWVELARVARHTDDLNESRSCYQCAYDLARTIGARVACGSTAESLARISCALEDTVSARKFADEAIAIYSDIGDAKRLARCLGFVESLSQRTARRPPDEGET